MGGDVVSFKSLQPMAAIWTFNVNDSIVKLQSNPDN